MPDAHAAGAGPPRREVRHAVRAVREANTTWVRVRPATPPRQRPPNPTNKKASGRACSHRQDENADAWRGVSTRNERGNRHPPATARGPQPLDAMQDGPQRRAARAGLGHRAEGLVALAIVVGAADGHQPVLMALALVAYRVAAFCLVARSLR